MAKILIIDDGPVNRQFLTTLLGYEHHDLREASDGAEGLRVAREHHPDLIISDVLMPTMDGYEFVRQLREDPGIGRTPVVFSTAHYLSRESQALALKCGITSIIYKPCEPKVVLDIVAAALSGRVKPEPPAVTEPEDFDREHLQLLTNKLSENAEQLRDAHGKLTALIELSTDLAKERDPAELLDRYCSVAREVIGARWTMVALLDGDRKAVQHLGTVGIDVEDTPALRSALLEAGVFATLTKEGRPICLSDVTSTPATLRLPDSLPRAGSLLVAPLAIRGHVDGWICLADKLGFDAFSEQDEHLAAAFAAKVAVAYDNARLYSESTKYAAKLETEISERVRAERELSESKARLAGIIGSAMDAIITIDSDQRIVLFNEAAERMFRCTAADAIGKPLDRFIPPRFRPSHSKDIRRFGETGVTTRTMGATRAISGLRADGEEFPVEASISQIEVGQQKLYTVIMRDITERKRAEEQLRLQGAALESAANAIMITDAQGKIIWVNPSFVEITGYSFEEAVGRNPRLLKSGKQDSEFYKEMWDTILSGKVWRNTLINRRKDGTLINEDLTITPIISGSGKITHFVGIKQDITELVRALSDARTKGEELASMTQHLWQASKLATMGELAASVAHELNNPLATVALRTENLLLAMPADSEQRKPLEIIAQEVDRMATLVNNLLQFSRRSHRQISTVDPREEITNSVEFIHYLLRSHNIEVIREFADVLPSIQADRQQLRQLFLNLLTNASDAMPQGGELTVRAASNGLDDAAVTIDFADSGEGITTENLEKIWDPFFTTKPEGKGTGLGLAICRRIVEEHGGTISIHSEDARGTTVRIVLPATSSGALS